MKKDTLTASERYRMGATRQQNLARVRSSSAAMTVAQHSSVEGGQEIVSVSVISRNGLSGHVMC